MNKIFLFSLLISLLFMQAAEAQLLNRVKRGEKAAVVPDAPTVAEARLMSKEERSDLYAKIYPLRTDSAAYFIEGLDLGVHVADGSKIKLAAAVARGNRFVLPLEGFAIFHLTEIGSIKGDEYVEKYSQAKDIIPEGSLLLAVECPKTSVYKNGQEAYTLYDEKVERRMLQMADGQYILFSFKEDEQDYSQALNVLAVLGKDKAAAQQFYADGRAEAIIKEILKKRDQKVKAYHDEVAARHAAAKKERFERASSVRFPAKGKSQLPKSIREKCLNELISISNNGGYDIGPLLYFHITADDFSVQRHKNGYILYRYWRGAMATDEKEEGLARIIQFELRQQYLGYGDYSEEVGIALIRYYERNYMLEKNIPFGQ